MQLTSSFKNDLSLFSGHVLTDAAEAPTHLRGLLLT